MMRRRQLVLAFAAAVLGVHGVWAVWVGRRMFSLPIEAGGLLFAPLGLCIAGFGCWLGVLAVGLVVDPGRTWAPAVVMLGLIALVFVTAGAAQAWFLASIAASLLAIAGLVVGALGPGDGWVRR